MYSSYYSFCRVFRFSILLFLKFFCFVFFFTKVNYKNTKNIPWEKINLILFLNHTSLFEFIFITIVPIKYLWRMSEKLIFPVADISYDKFLFGNFIKKLGPYPIRISRKRDKSWSYFLRKLTNDKILIFPAEGRMRRKTGLDKDGKPLTVRSGVCDILKKYESCPFLIMYSHGIHHVYAPEDKLPKLFKRISITIEMLSVSDYCKKFTKDSVLNKKALRSDLDRKRDEII